METQIQPKEEEEEEEKEEEKEEKENKSVLDKKTIQKPNFHLPINQIVNTSEEEEEEEKFENSFDFLSPRILIKTPKTPRIEKEQNLSQEERQKLILRKITKSGVNITDKNREKAKHLALSISDSEKFFESFFLKEIEEKETWKIKLIISEIKHTQLEKNFRSLVSPLLQISEVTAIHASYGLFHTAILVNITISFLTSSRLDLYF